MPEGWRKRPDKSIKQGSEGRHHFSPRISREYEMHLKKCTEFYEDLLDEGVAPEMARMVLPQSMMVNFIWSGNLLAFYHVWNLRSGEGAQDEAKEFAELLKQAIEPEFPIAWRALEER
jgi:thymidylate synthase (FAD)